MDLPRSEDQLHPFDVFDLLTRTWTRQPTSGIFPKHRGLGSSLVYDDESDTIYLLGGWGSMIRRDFDLDIYACSLENFVWSKVVLKSGVKPRPRYNTEVLLHNNK